MCGIAGIINFDHTPVIPQLLDQMTSLLQERGPDNTGKWLADYVGLAHTRLSIIDLSENGNQPFHGRQTTICFNGEIYNYQSLRQELVKAGHPFRSTSDTEVIVAGYEQWGLDILLRKIEGMFAFCLYDRIHHKLILVRDAFGKKPLYYFNNSKSLIFSSDIKAIWNVSKKHLTLNTNSIDYYLSELTVPQPFSIWNEISQIPPGEYRIFDTLNANTESKVWYCAGTNKKDVPFSEVEIINQSEALLLNSIKKRMVADVPVGCFLSGGVDSGLIVSLLAQYSTGKVKTFSVGFESSEHNELPYAKNVADRYGTEHEEIIIQPSIEKDLEHILSFYGEPFADSSAIPSYYICKAIKNKVKVALSGDGGDEAFGGYPQYQLSSRADNFSRNYKNKICRDLAVIVDKVLGRLSGGRENLGSYQHYMHLNGHEKLNRGMGFSSSEKHKLYSHDLNNGFTKNYLDAIWANHLSSDNSLTRTLMTSSLKTRLLNDYLVKVDRSSMMNSLEVRSPFLDRELVDFCLSIPLDIMFKGGNTKYILKKLASKHIGHGIFERPKKGFTIPLRQWLNQGFAPLVDDYLLSGALSHRGYFNQSFIKKLVLEHRSNSHDHSHRIWSLLCLEIWFQKFS